MRHGSHIDPPNRFESVRREPNDEYDSLADESPDDSPRRDIEYLFDATRSIVTENDSPDLPFRYSINPYRGCIHGCSYCYARPGHEYLGMNAGLDFETKIVVKRDAAKHFREFLSRKTFVPEPIAFSGVTDCYQPAERTFRLTRQCLEIASQCHLPVSIVTKNALVLRDLDLLQSMARRSLVHVYLSITTLDADLARAMEPRTSIPDARLRAIGQLAEAGVPVGVMTAPVIPGLNEVELPAILKAASEAGAKTAGYVLLRLPMTVQPVFIEWLERTQPLKAERVLKRIRQTRHGKLNDSSWGERMVGTGELAEQIRNLFRMFQTQYGLNERLPPHDCRNFLPPPNASGQLALF